MTSSNFIGAFYNYSDGKGGNKLSLGFFPKYSEVRLCNLVHIKE